MSKSITKSILGIAYKIITVIIVAVAVFMMVFTLISTLTFDKNDRSLFGIRFYVVLTDSMSLSENNQNDKVHFDSGDIVLIKDVQDKAALQPDEVIAFVSQNSESYGKTITHKIREVKKTDDGRVIGYITYGTNTGKNDDTIVEPDFVIGSYAGKLPGVGHFFDFLKSTPGYVVCILIPFLLLILWQGAGTIRLFRRYKREQMADMEAERAEIAKEREQSAKMMEELMALREQLAKQAEKEADSTEEAKVNEFENGESNNSPADTDA